jgi:hypothetical protein
MMFILADVLAPLGQAAAIILAIYLFVNILIGLVFAVVFMFAIAWVGDKVALVKNLRPTIESVNAAIKNPEESPSHAGEGQEAKLLQAVHAVQSAAIPQRIEGVREQAQSIEEKLNRGADRVAETMIELRARTVQAQGIVKAFFLPGLTRRKRFQLPAASTPVLAIPPVTSAGSAGAELAQAAPAGVESTGNASHA